jgi:hypothetical protein
LIGSLKKRLYSARSNSLCNRRGGFCGQSTVCKREMLASTRVILLQFNPFDDRSGGRLFSKIRPTLPHPSPPRRTRRNEPWRLHP